jgi:hypothetical protein
MCSPKKQKTECVSHQTISFEDVLETNFPKIKHNHVPSNENSYGSSTQLMLDACIDNDAGSHI